MSDSATNTTMTNPDGNPDFPVWAIAVIVLAVVGITVAVAVGVVLYKRKRMNAENSRGHVQESRNNRDISVYENTEAPEETNAKRPESTVYDEIDSRDNKLTDTKVYQNATFHGDEHYQGLGPSESVFPPSLYTGIK